MVAVQEGRLTSVALADVADRQRTVPQDAPMVAAALAIGTSFGAAGLGLCFDPARPSALMT
jgi:6-phosphofructokinase 1